MRAPVSETRPPYPLPNPYPLKNILVVSTTKRRGWERGWEKLGKGEKILFNHQAKTLCSHNIRGKTKQNKNKPKISHLRFLKGSTFGWQVKEIVQSLKILITFLIITDSASIQWLLDF